MSDGSTDSAVIEDELVYVRFCQKGLVTVQFVGMQSVERANAQHISEAISFLMRQIVSDPVETAGISASQDPWKEKLVDCGTDSAAVMTVKWRLLEYKWLDVPQIVMRLLHLSSLMK
ncbi:UNVERIFIED_CONTAM: hypothetical protein FKN15_068041 [Acipenser sinensis]